MIYIYICKCRIDYPFTYALACSLPTNTWNVSRMLSLACNSRHVPQLDGARESFGIVLKPSCASLKLTEICGWRPSTCAINHWGLNNHRFLGITYHPCESIKFLGDHLGSLWEYQAMLCFCLLYEQNCTVSHDKVRSICQSQRHGESFWKHNKGNLHFWSDELIWGQSADRNCQGHEGSDFAVRFALDTLQISTCPGMRAHSVLLMDKIICCRTSQNYKINHLRRAGSIDTG